MNTNQYTIPSQHPFSKLDEIRNDVNIESLMPYCREITEEYIVFVFPHNLIQYDVEEMKKYFKSISIDYKRESYLQGLGMIDESSRRILEERVTCYYKDKRTSPVGDLNSKKYRCTGMKVLNLNNQ
jgi:hypothetical protein